MSQFFSDLRVSLHLGTALFTFFSSFAFAGSLPFEYGLANLGHCSGAIFRLEDSRPEDTALLLTAGHCSKMGSFHGMPAPGERFHDVPVDVSAKVGTMNQDENLIEVHSKRLIFATMTDTDFAVYETDKTYAELGAGKVDVLTLPRVPPSLAAGDTVVVPVGRTFSIIETQFVQSVEAVKEGPYLWKHSMVLNKQQGLGPGTSGAPVVLRGTKMIVGLINSGRDGDDTHCSMSNPCLVDEQGEVVPAPPGAPIAQPIHQLYDCLDAGRKFDLKLPSCRL